MHSNLQRLASMLLVASAITLVGANSPAQARRHVEWRAAAGADSWQYQGDTGWSAQSSGARSWSARSWGYARERVAVRDRHQRQANVSWENSSQASRQQINSNDWSDTSQGHGEWANVRERRAEGTRQANRKVRVASLGNGSYGGVRGGGGSAVVAEARRWIGTNPTGWNHVWCGKFMNFVLERTGRRGTGSNLAMSFAHYGSRVSGPQVGAIAVMGRRGGGHVGVVSGIDSSGNPIIISGNFRNRVAEVAYPRSRILAYVMP